ncbi:MAG: GGDEF and EAL domain-containing protein [Lachnospiraceae bacterium]|nr:GGDEF and EAL domain-containing protein [Lachnospiraceae bacterium]
MEIDRESKRRLDSLYEAFSTVAQDAYVFLCNMKYDYSRWSKNAVNFFGLPGEYMENAGGIWEEYIHPDDRADYHASIERIFTNSDSGHDMQYRARAVDGSYVVCTCRGVVMMGEDGKPLYFGGSIKNHGMTSYIDPITGLRSLYGFFEDLKTMFQKKDVGIILEIGISNFANYNDLHGYSFGNRILQSFARLLSQRFANAGAVYRLDGTKFSVITHTLTLDEVKDIYQEIHDYVRSSFFVDERKVAITINAGDMLVDNFDITDKIVYTCLRYSYYESKNLHMGDLVTFVDGVNDNNRITLNKLDAIRNSVLDGCSGFFLTYQPIMHADSLTLRGVEALLRWKNDTYGLVPPIQFIPVLEQDAVFPILGKWILKQAMTDGCKLMEKYPDIIVNINLSYAQLKSPGFVEEVLTLLSETGLPAHNLCLEITERCRLVNKELLYDIITIFRSMGIKIALDDFGTGYSTLEILRELKVDTVKIDRGFVMNIETSTADQATLKCVSELASSFNADVCVEGVETKDMQDFIRQYRVSSLQGYYYSKPVPLDEFMNREF